MNIITPISDRTRQYSGHFYGNETVRRILIALDTLSNTAESGKTIFFIRKHY